jgi:hypothetical protein
MGKAIKIEGLANTPNDSGKELKEIFAELTQINDEAISLLEKTYKQNVQLRKIVKIYRYIILGNAFVWLVYCLFLRG